MTPLMMHLEEIRSMFRDEVTITLLVRNLERDDADVLITDDLTAKIVKAVKKLSKKEKQ